MENNNKYYTPEIEEFNFGFTYEVLVKGEWKETALKPCHTAYLQTDLDPENINDIDEAIKEGVVRVKLLDHEDIKSLGWHMVWRDSHVTDYILADWIINLNINGKHFQIFKGKSPHFRGYVKNKSELKRLMKQLGIL